MAGQLRVNQQQKSTPPRPAMTTDTIRNINIF